MDPWEGLQEKLYFEMRGRIKEDDSTVPAKEGPCFYYTRFEEGSQYPIYCRKFQTLDAAEEVLLDVNQLAPGPGLHPDRSAGKQPGSQMAGIFDG